MRILVAAPPKTGNVWLEKMFSLNYGLQWIRSSPAYDYWGTRDTAPLADFIASGTYPHGSVCHQHYWPSDPLFQIAQDNEIRLATTLRDPYDQFVSWYFYIQNFSDAFVAANDPGQRAIGKPIGHVDVLDLLSHEFGVFLDQGIAWLESGRSLIVRYEQLHSAPEAVLAASKEYLSLTPARTMADAIAGASVDNMRLEGPDLKRHIRTGRAGAWSEHLTGSHREIFLSRHGERLERLGYPPA
jgi:Sulfotransferase domain